MNYKVLPKGYRYAGTLDFMRNRAQMKAVLIIQQPETVISITASSATKQCSLNS